MHSIASRLASIIDEQLPVLHQIPEDKFSYKPSPNKWSKKEIIGHLIDSAQSNIRRLIVAQYDESPHIVYNQNQWVLINNYQQWNTSDLIQLWWLLNKQFCAILQNMPAVNYERTVQTEALHTLEWLADDYVKHLLHHLHVVLELEPVKYP